MNIVLIGYRGTGKSAVGRILAERLNKTYEGMDANIVRGAGMPIAAIVEQSGWSTFRDMETRQAMDLARKDDQIIDTGGGIIERPDNLPALQKNGCIFWLKASVGTIVARIRGDDQRPALTEGKTFVEEVAEVLQQREARYRAAAHHAIDTDTLTPQQVADRIVSLLKSCPQGRVP